MLSFAPSTNQVILFPSPSLGAQDVLSSFNSKLFDLIKETNGKPASVKELENSSEEKATTESYQLQQLLNSLSKQQQVQSASAAALNQLSSGGRRSVNSNSSSSSLVNSSSTNHNLELELKPPKNSGSPTSFSFSNRNSPNQQTAPFSLNGTGTNGGSLLLASQNASLLNSSSLTVNSANNLSNLNASNHSLSANASNSSNSSSFPNRTRIRTSFDPEHELPKLQQWFGENQHPSRQQIQDYVRILNNLESRRGRKPLDVNNVVYWFKNARAAAKRNPGARIGMNGQSPQQQMNGSSLSGLGEQLNPNELMLAQFQQRQLMSQLQLLNQQNQSSIADLLNSGAGKNALKSLMLKNGLDDELQCEQDEDDQRMNDFGQQSRDSEEDDNPNEDTDQTFSNFAQTLDLSVKQQQQQQQSTGGSNLKRRKLDTSSTFDECEEQDDKDSIDGSASPVNQKFRNSLSSCSKQRFSMNSKLNLLNKPQVNPAASQRHLLLDPDAKEENAQSLVNSDGELDEENAESDGELDEKDYCQPFMREALQNAGRNFNLNQLTQGLIANSNNANLANLISGNYLQTVNDFFMNRLLSPQAAGNAASALANNNLLSSAAGLIAASSAGALNPNNVVGPHPLAALGNPSAAGAFPGGNLLLNNPHSPDDSIRRIRRSRTFIDPITEVPRLQAWFSQNTHPSHSQIVCYTDDLNKLPYRQKFPKLEPKNVQFWFKNHRAKVSLLGELVHKPARRRSL